MDFKDFIYKFKVNTDAPLKMSPALYLTVLLGLWMGAEACGPKENCCKVCPAGWAQFGSACYIYYHSAMAWADAEKFCTSIGGNLASVHSKDEYLYLRNAVLRTTGQHSTAWLGGYDAAKEGVWLWSDGSKFDFKFWAAGEPNNAGGHENCMEMNFRGKDFVNDIPCGPKRPFICKKAL